RVAVLDVRDALDAAAAEAEGREQDRGERRAAPEDAGRELRVERVSPPGPEAVREGALEDRARLRSSPRDHREPGGREDGDREPDPPDRRVEIALREREDRRCEQEVEGEEGKLVDDEAEPEAQARTARAARPWRGEREERAGRDDESGDEVA